MHDCRLDGARLYCDCRVGFILAEDGKTCRGKRTHVSCSSSLVASFHNEMRQTTFNMRRCLRLLLLLRVSVPDIDECQTEASNCAHGCTNTLGSYVCVCNAAYELGSDGKQCYSAFHVRKGPAITPPPPPPLLHWQQMINLMKAPRLTSSDRNRDGDREQLREQQRRLFAPLPAFNRWTRLLL